MKIVVFDIDGTLTETIGVDNRLFAAALRRVLDLSSEPDLFEFDDVTDSGTVRGLCARHSTRPCHEVEAEVEELFLELLEDAVTAEPEAFQPVPGARTVMERIRNAGWIPAMATGSWKRSAVLKLRAAKIDVEGVPLATSSLHPQRRMIIQHALRAAGAKPKTQAVYVGDGTWDIKAARQVGIGFLGRGIHGNAETLRNSGASRIIPDFTELACVLEGLEASMKSVWNAA